MTYTTVVYHRLFITMFIVINLLLAILPAQGAIDCLCAKEDLSVPTNTGHLVVARGECTGIEDKVGDSHQAVWFQVKHGNENQHAQIYPLSVKNTFWAHQNCKKYCNVCDTHLTMCGDEEPNCHLYGKSACSQYGVWARQKRKQYCGFCDEFCLDNLKDCSSYGKSVCTQYASWALTHCQNFCDLCGKYT
ncbi:uncharacterized protein LOC125374145 [Haliotis rufescens]|uniref:uncharacterized protein LOC125374145 n=1 Tax=Haliotis rufescens TaxID=6454 RepID=UPI00201F502B|nr:uncharacterized protein LOC125374145 [Haliotis rufescens]